MTYLFFQIWLWIIASFVLGWVSHWFLCCRGKDESRSNIEFDSSSKTVTSQSMQINSATDS